MARAHNYITGWFIMFRNTYLELYKTSAVSQQGLSHLIAHFTQIYNTLGCVLQDLEFQVGKLLAVPPAHPPLQLQTSHSPPNPPPRREPLKKEVKIEELSLGKAPELPPVQPNPVDVPKHKLRAHKDQQSHRKDWQPNLSNKLESAKQIARGPLGSDSFDSLFDARRPQAHSPMQIERRPGTSGEVRQQSNTYEDFMQRLFREQQGRRSR